MNRVSETVKVIKSQQASFWCEAILASDCITARDVAVLRAEIFPAGLVSDADASALFALDRAPIAKDQLWEEFFVETLTDYLVWGRRPTGCLELRQAEWVMAESDKHPTLASLALLLNLVDEAHRAPAWFASAARRRAANVTAVMPPDQKSEAADGSKPVLH